MKKALQDQEEVFLYIRNGKIHPWDFSIDEILAAVNRGLKGDWGADTKETIILRELYEWISRYIEEGATEELCNDLNADLHQMQYSKYVVPPDFFPSEDGDSQCLYLANLSKDYTHEIHAANDFSKIITSGMLNRLKRCQMPGCENIFLGPPQAKWCSKTCGSKYRVREKRRRDSS
jgi:predicted RNA-binding Zn ribbon-like protein